MVNIAKRGKPKGSKNKTYNRTLQPKEKSLADVYLQNKYTLAKCFELSDYKCDMPSYTKENKSMKAKEIIERPHVQEYIKEMQAESRERIHITRDFISNVYLDVITKNEAREGKGASSKIKAAENLSKMYGYDKPTEEETTALESRYFELPARAIGKAFVDINRDIDNNKYKQYDFEGGRGSLKSSFVALKFIEKLEQNVNMCGIAIRQYTNTIGDSIFSQLIWAIEYLGLQADYKWIKSPYEITKKSTGQKIYFRGNDDPTKLKSIKPPLGMYLGIQWIEEFDQIKGGMPAVRTVEQSIVRGGDLFYRFKSYNTPQSHTHFVNVEKVLPKDGRIVHKSNYLDAPKEWLGQAFIEEAEYLKEVNPTAYDNEYMGVVTGVGGMVFTNLDIRPITDEEYAGFDDAYQGLDFGFYPDPLHWSNCYFNTNTRTLYITDEFRANKMSNRALYDYLVENKKINEYTQIIADSAEPKSIQDLRDYGAYIRGAEKGAGSVNYSIKWLAYLNKIVIDPNKAPYTAKEFSEYELEKDKDGNYTSNFSGENDHSIASVRYALNMLWRRKGQ